MTVETRQRPLTLRGEYGPAYQMYDPGDGVIGAAVRAGRPYEGKLLYHIYRRGFKGTAIDVGAHVGNHTLWLSLACDLKVLAFEPIEYEGLLDNLQLNELDAESVQTWPVALGDHHTRARSVGKGELVEDERGPIPVVALDDFKDYALDVSVIKIDVEGMEPEVLRGAKQTIERCRPVIYAEAQDRAAHDRNAGELWHLGYVQAGTFGATPMEEWVPCN